MPLMPALLTPGTSSEADSMVRVIGQFLLEVEGHGGLGDDVLRDGLAGAHDLDLALEALIHHHHVEALDLLVGDLDALGGLGLEALEAEGHGVVTGSQERRDEVTVGLRDDDLVALRRR